MSRRGLFLLFAVLTVFLCLGEAFPQTINIVVGGSRGGFGDIASNILMAQQIKSLRPESRVNILWSPDISEKDFNALKTLVPAFNRERGNQTLNGIHYSNSASSSDADLLVGFSLSSAIMLGGGRGNEPLRLAFREYNDGERKVSFVEEFVRALTYLDIAGPGLAGLYVQPGLSSPPLTREQLFTHLERRLGLGTLNPAQDLIVFAYTSSINTSEQYIDAVSRMVTKTKSYWNKRLLIFTPATEANVKRIWPMPANIKIIPVKTMPFQLSKSLIAHADLPVMVTGDVSATLAIDYEKPFFYERNDWKKGFSRTLIQQLTQAPEFIEASRETLEHLGIILKIDPRKLPDVDALVEALQNHQLWANMRAALKNLKQQSLPEKVLLYADIFRSAPNWKPNADEISLILSMAEKVKNFDQFIFEVMNDLKQEGISVEKESILLRWLKETSAVSPADKVPFFSRQKLTFKEERCLGLLATLRAKFKR